LNLFASELEMNLYTGFGCVSQSVIFIGEDGKFYRWGRTDRGQLCKPESSEPVLLPEPFEFSFAKTDGALFSFEQERKKEGREEDEEKRGEERRGEERRGEERRGEERRGAE
jgi:hypothetical protein